MTVTWTSGYGINEAEPFVEWGPTGGDRMRAPAGTLTFSRKSMCGVYILFSLNFFGINYARNYWQCLDIELRCTITLTNSNIYRQLQYNYFVSVFSLRENYFI